MAKDWIGNICILLKQMQIGLYLYLPSNPDQTDLVAMEEKSVKD